MSYLDFYGYPEDFTARYPEQIKELTAADLLATAKRRIHPDDLQIVIVGNEGDFAEPLSSLGIAYETIDLTIPEPPSTFEIPEETQESFAEGKRLLAEAAEATGGIEAWTSIRDIAAEVEMAVTVQGMNLSVFISSIHTSDGRGYVSQVLPFGEVIMAFDGEEGWKKSPQGIEAMAPEEREEMLNGRARDFSEIFAKIDAIKAQALGRQEFADRECEVVLLSGERLSQVLLFLDPETKMPVGMRHRDRAMGGPVEATRILDDFRSVGPVKMAHSIEILHDGEPFAKAIVKKMVINGGVDETKFARPE